MIRILWKTLNLALTVKQKKKTKQNKKKKKQTKTKQNKKQQTKKKKKRKETKPKTKQKTKNKTKLTKHSNNFFSMIVASNQNMVWNAGKIKTVSVIINWQELLSFS